MGMFQTVPLLGQIAEDAAGMQIGPGVLLLSMMNPVLAAEEVGIHGDGGLAKGELNYANNYTLLVAVVLSAQATDVGVNKATKKLFEEADNPAAMLVLGEAGLKQHIRSIGLYNTKGKNVIALSRRLLDHFAFRRGAGRPLAGP